MIRGRQTSVRAVSVSRVGESSCGAEGRRCGLAVLPERYRQGAAGDCMRSLNLIR